ncbi:MAG: hypothetical protein JSU06_13945 [Actinobacteria bacterium]|nr:hypothetical protein [Actinomycetota bacterium]
MKVLVLITVAAAALLAVVAGSAAAKHSSVLPKEFPYAAEIQATIEYDGTYTYADTGFERCGVTADGHEVNISGGARDTLHFQRTLYFSHITVPVATAKELGAAAGRLTVKPTVTTKGKVEHDHSTLDTQYTVAEGENDACHAISGSCHWELIPLPSSIVETVVAQDNGFLPRSWTISVLGVNTPDGSCAVADGTQLMTAMLSEAGRLYPADLNENFPEVTISTGAGEEFHRLQHAETVRFKVNLDTPVSGSTTCPLTSEEMESCTHGVTGTAKVKLHRIFLYRTKQAYQR